MSYKNFSRPPRSYNSKTQVHGLRSVLEQTQKELASELQSPDKVEAMLRGRSNEELERVQESLKVKKERVYGKSGTSIASNSLSMTRHWSRRTRRLLK